MGYSSTITSELDGHQWLLYTPAAIIPGWNTGTPEMKGLVGPRDGPDVWKKRKIFVPTRIGILDYPVGGIGAILTMLSQPGDFHPRTGHEGLAMGT